MSSEHETVVVYYVEVPKTRGVGWWGWTDAVRLDRAREVVATLKTQGREARIVKETTTTVREVLE